MNRTLQAAAGQFAVRISPCVSDRIMAAGRAAVSVSGGAALWTVTHAHDRIMGVRAGAITVRISDQVTTSDDGAPIVPPGGGTRQIICQTDRGKFTMAGSDARLKPKKGPPM